MIELTTDGNVATVTMNDPERRNALSNAAISSLKDAVETTALDEQIRVVVITGAGDRAFAAGGDLAGGFVDSPLADHNARGALADLFRTMWQNPKPIVGRINGAALGGGFGIAAACDITISADTAIFGTPEIDLGLWPMMISTVLGDVVPSKRLLEMMMLGQTFDAAEAKELGIVTTVAPQGGLDDAVEKTVALLLAKSPSALALGKTTFYSMRHMDTDTALDYLHIGLTAVSFTEDAVEGVAAFNEKRLPEWNGR